MIKGKTGDNSEVAAVDQQQAVCLSSVAHVVVTSLPSSASSTSTGPCNNNNGGVGRTVEHMTGSSSSSGDTGLGTCPAVDQSLSQALPFLTPTPMRASVTPSVVPEWLLIYFRAPEKFDHFVDWNSYDLPSLMAYDAMLGEILKSELNEVTALYERYQAALYRHYYMRAQGGSNRSVVLNSQSDLASGTSLSTSIDEKSMAALGGVLSNSDTQVNRMSPTPPQRSIATVVRHLSSGMADYRMSLGATSNMAPRHSSVGPSRLSVGNYGSNSHYTSPAAIAANRRPRSSFFVAGGGSGLTTGGDHTGTVGNSHRGGYENIAQIIAQERHRFQQLPQTYVPQPIDPYPSSATQNASSVGNPGALSSMPPPPPPLPSRYQEQCQRGLGVGDCSCSRCMADLARVPFNFDELAGVLPPTSSAGFLVSSSQQPQLARRLLSEVANRLPQSPLINNSQPPPPPAPALVANSVASRDSVSTLTSTTTLSARSSDAS